MTDHKEHMRKALKLAEQNVEQGGGPFGAVIVKEGEIIAMAANSVTSDNDPTAHAEVNVIRKACAKLKTFDLSDCVIYTSCEPCPMCLGAIYWAHIPKVYYGNNKFDARNIGFDDSFIYEEIDLPMNQRSISFEQLLPDEAKKAFTAWEESENKIDY